MEAGLYCIAYLAFIPIIFPKFEPETPLQNITVANRDQIYDGSAS
jgi:hypothetical protein